MEKLVAIGKLQNLMKEYQCLPSRSSLLQMFFKTGAFNVTPFTGKHLCWYLFLIKFIKKNLQPRCLSVNMARFVRASILQNIGSE